MSQAQTEQQSGTYQAHFRVWRGDADAGELADFTDEVHEGEVVLDIVHRLQATQAPDLAERLSALGCGFALDDFGTGYGSFTYLKHLPVDYLKIDMEFVRNLKPGSPDVQVVSAIIDVARKFGIQTVAEGVESQETLRGVEGLLMVTTSTLAIEMEPDAAVLSAVRWMSRKKASVAALPRVFWVSTSIS